MLDRLKKRLTSSLDELDRFRLQARFEGVAVTSIVDLPEREPVRLCGEVQGMQTVQRVGAPSLELTLDDGTGRVVAVFTGRRTIGGVHPGQGMVLEGVARRERNRLVLLNPGYTILASGH